MRGSSLTDGCLITRMCFDLFDPAHEPYRSSIFFALFQQSSNDLQEIYQRRDGREEQEITTNTRNRKERDEILTPGHLLRVVLHPGGQLGESLLVPGWRPLEAAVFRPGSTIHILLECSFKKHEKFGIKVYHLHQSTCLSKAFSQNFRPQKSHCLYLVWRGSIDNCFCFYTIINYFSSVPNQM